MFPAGAAPTASGARARNTPQAVASPPLALIDWTHSRGWGGRWTTRRAAGSCWRCWTSRRVPADLAGRLGLTRAKPQRHLTCLRGGGLVVAERRGRHVRYGTGRSRPQARADGPGRDRPRHRPRGCVRRRTCPVHMSGGHGHDHASGTAAAAQKGRLQAVLAITVAVLAA